MGLHGPRKKNRNKHGFTTPPPPLGLTGLDIEKPSTLPTTRLQVTCSTRLSGFWPKRSATCGNLTNWHSGCSPASGVGTSGRHGLPGRLR